jgi:hypothetical protein
MKEVLTTHASSRSGQKAVPTGLRSRNGATSPTSHLASFHLPEQAMHFNRRKDGIAVLKVSKVRE